MGMQLAAPEGAKKENHVKTEIQFDNGGGITVQTSNFCWYGNDAAQAAEIAHGCVTSRAAEVKKFESQDDAMRFCFGSEKSSTFRRASTPSELIGLIGQCGSGHAAREFSEALGKILELDAAQVDDEYSPEAFWDALDATPRGREAKARIDCGWATTADRKFCEKLPAFADGPTHAPTAVIFEIFGE
jgi:hypothetical protein